MPIAIISSGIRLHVSDIICWLKCAVSVAAQCGGLYGHIPTPKCPKPTGILATMVGTRGATTGGHPCRATTDHLHTPVLPVTLGRIPVPDVSFSTSLLCTMAPQILLGAVATTDAALPGRRTTTATPCPGCWCSSSRICVHPAAAQASSDGGFAAP